MIQFAETLAVGNYPTDVVRLRPAEPGDVQKTFDVVTDPANNEYLAEFNPWAEDFTRELAQSGVDYQMASAAEGDGVQYCLEEDGDLIGKVTLFGREGNVAKLGYWLVKGAQHKGYATQAAQAVLREGKEKLGLESVQIRIRPGNEPSEKVATRLGALNTGEQVDEANDSLVIWRLEL